MDSTSDAPANIAPPGKVAAVLNDLVFGTKIRSTAASLGVECILLRTANELQSLNDEQRVSLVIVDLNSAKDEALPAIRAARLLPDPPHIVAFVSHVDEELARQATDAGAHEVLPRSRFSAQLPSILRFKIDS